MKHRAPSESRKIWETLRDAGVVLIVIMGVALIGLAIGVAFCTRMIP